jgi:hypothetical protein
MNKDPPTTFMAFVKEHWSIVAIVATGLVTWGITTADIAQLKADRDEAKKDHDLLVELRVEQRTIRQDVTEIKASVKELAKQKEARDEKRP